MGCVVVVLLRLRHLVEVLPVLLIKRNLFTRLDKGVDLSAVLSRLGQQGSVMHLSKDTLEADSVSTKEQMKAKEKKKEEHQPILKYLKTQVRFFL